MLVAGDLDAVITARPPRPFIDGDARVARLFPDVFAEEVEYYKATGIFPIMHTVAIQREIYDKNRWIAVELYRAFEEAKRRNLARVREVTASLIGVPWLSHHVERVEALLGADFWPYGVEPNRRTLEALLRWAYEQGVCYRPLAVEELFAPETLDLARV